MKMLDGVQEDVGVVTVRGLIRVVIGGVVGLVVACTPAERPLADVDAAEPADSGVATRPSGAATYRNPVIESRGMADPHVIRVGETYYMYPTTHTRGYDAYVSKDLVNWEHAGSVYDDPHGGAWAPDVFHDRRGDGRFYLYYTDNDPDRPRAPLHKQIGVAVADSPLGPFEDVKSLAAPAIDAHLFQDDDGRYYLYYVDLEGGFKIMARPMADPLTPEGQAREVIRPTEAWEKVSGHVTEGPFMLKRKDTYYLMYSGTGADSPNYGIGYATSTSPLGPFVKYPENPIVGRSEQVLGPGHHCVVEGPDGKLWMVYHQKVDDQQNFRRFVALDPLWFDQDGVIHARATKGVEQSAPGE